MTASNQPTPHVANWQVDGHNLFYTMPRCRALKHIKCSRVVGDVDANAFENHIAVAAYCREQNTMQNMGYYFNEDCLSESVACILLVWLVGVEHCHSN